MALLIKSKKEGFRRCGVAHSVEETRWPDDAFTPEQLEALKVEPMLLVVVVVDEPVEESVPVEESAAKKTKAAKE